MKLSYNVTGDKRKSLVSAISQEMNAPINYLGAPTFAYEVGGYRIDKTGTVTGPDNLDLEADLQGIYCFEAAKREYDEPDTYESGLGGMSATPSIEDMGDEAEAWAEREVRRMRLEGQNIPDYSNRGQYGGDDIPNYEDLRLTEREELGLGRERRENPQGENGMQASDVPEPDQPDILAVEYPLDGFTPEALDNLSKMVAAKEPLIKAALGAEELPIQTTKDTIRFPWFTLDDPSQAAYYVQFIWALCKTAKEKKRVTAKERGLADNPKYTMRCWLLSLGLIGDEYKMARKLLLSRLSGDSSWKNGKKAEVACDEVSE